MYGLTVNFDISSIQQLEAFFFFLKDCSLCQTAPQSKKVLDGTQGTTLICSPTYCSFTETPQDGFNALSNRNVAVVLQQTMLIIISL